MAVILFRLLVLYAVIVLAAYIFQRQLQYFPDKTPLSPSAEIGVPEMKVIDLLTEDHVSLKAWYAPPKEKNGVVIVFFHGNAGNLQHRAFKAREFIDAGFGVILCGYRGYGGNAGYPTEEGFYADGRAHLAFLEKEGITAGQIALYGESIGSGTAVQMAVELQPKFLILEAPFTSLPDAGKAAYFWLPVDLLTKDRFDNLSKIKKIKSALLILHGDRDNVVPFALGKQLFDAANHPKEFVAIAGGRHSDLYDFKAEKMIIEWVKNQ